MLCRKQNEPLSRYSRAPYGLLTTDYRSLYSFSKTICTWDARARARTGTRSFKSNKIGIGKNSEEREASNLHLLLLRLLHFLTKITMENSLFQSMDGGFKLQLTAHSSFHKIKLSKRKLLPETFSFFLI